MGYVRGVDRHQGGLFATALDELIPADHPVRVIDAFVDQLSLGELGFSKVSAKATGRPAYDPADLLKLYIYGYLHRVRTSRRLEQESRRNVEVMWLVNRLSPDFKTIADFRRDNGEPIKRVCAGFVQFCRQAQLLTGEQVAIDGSKFAGQNARDRNFNQSQLQQRLQRTEEKIEQYLRELDEQDAQDPGMGLHAEHTAAALQALRERRGQIEQWLSQMAERGELQLSLTDPDARKMRTGQGEWVIGYNVQTAVDSETHLVVHHEVTQAGNDRQQLADVAQHTQAVLGSQQLEALADTGYSNAEAAAQCEASGITTYVPREHGVNHHGPYFDKRAFVYDPHSDTYRCPAGEQLHFRGQSPEGQRSYRSAACGGCSLKGQCTAAAQRTVTRHVHERALEAMDARARSRPDLMRKRKAVVEHPFGTLKWLMDGGRLLTRGLKSVSAEMALAVLAYNIRRVLNARGVGWMLARLAPRVPAY